MSQPFDRSKTLNELDAPAWGGAELGTHVVRTCHRLRNKPLAEFSVEDLRIMIGQNVCLRFLVPLALEVLEADPLASGDFYPGDLLVSVLRAEQDFWAQETDLRKRARAIMERLGEVPENLRESAVAFRENSA